MAFPRHSRFTQDIWANTVDNGRVIILILERDLTTDVPTYWTALIHSHATNPMAGVLSSIHVTKSSILNLPQAGLDTCTVIFHVNDYDLQGLNLPRNVRATFYLQRLFANTCPVDLRQFTSYEVMVKESLTTRMHNLGACTPYVWAEIIRHPRAVPNIFLSLCRSLPREIFQWNAITCMDILYRDLVTPANLPPHIGIPTFSNYTRPIAVIGSPNLRSDLRFTAAEWHRVNQMSQLSAAACPLPRFQAFNMLNQQPASRQQIPLAVGPQSFVPTFRRYPASLPTWPFEGRPRAPQPPVISGNAQPAAAPAREDQRQGRQPPPPGVELESPASPDANNVEPYVPEPVAGPSRARPSSSSSSTGSSTTKHSESDSSDTSESEEEGEIRDDRNIVRRRRERRVRFQPGPGFNPYRLAELHARGIRPGGGRQPNAVNRPRGFQPRFVRPYATRENRRLCFNCWGRGHMARECSDPPRTNPRYSRRQY